MSEETTKPNGGRELKVQETEDIERRMRDAGYSCHVNTMEAAFSPEEVKFQENDDGSGNEGTTAGKHTIVGVTGTVSFVQKIPAIAVGPSAPLRDRDRDKDKDKRRNKGETQKEGKTDKTLDE